MSAATSAPEGVPAFDDLALQAAMKWLEAQQKRRLEFARSNRAEVELADAGTDVKLVNAAARDMEFAMATMEAYRPRSIAGVRAVLDVVLEVYEQRRRNLDDVHHGGDVAQLIIHMRRSLDYAAGETELGFD